MRNDRLGSTAAVRYNARVLQPCLSKQTLCCRDCRPLGIRAAARGNKEIGRLEGGGIAFQLDCDPTTCLLDATDLSVQAELDTFGLEQPLQRQGNIRALMSDDLPGALDNHDIAAQTPVELRHLQTDIAAADDDKPARQLGPVQPVFGIEEVDFVEPIYWRDLAPRARVEHHLLCGHSCVADPEAESVPIAAFETRVAAQQCEIAGRGEPGFEPVARLQDNLLGAREYRREVNPDRWNAQSKFTRAARQLRYARRRDRGLCRSTTEIDARTSQMLAFR
jgi:hypothetical protein